MSQQHNTKTIGIVIPTFNMSEHILPLWQSICASGLADTATEILFVDDGSSDLTVNIINGIKDADKPLTQKIRTISFLQNRGRFISRYEGAKASVCSDILFLDTRLTLGNDFGRSLKRLSISNSALMGVVDIDISRSLFCLYWDRSHRRIFWRHFRDTKKPLTLDLHNYELYLKGTGVFYCSKNTFLEACNKFISTPLFSDDTLLMKEIVRTTPILIHPELRINWVPRETTAGFLFRLWDRGPGFAEYHIFNRRGVFFWMVMSGLAWLSLILYCLFFDTMLALSLIASTVFAIILSTALFARSITECFLLAPLHLATVLTFSAGVVRGIVINTIRKFKNRPSRNTGDTT